MTTRHSGSDSQGSKHQAKRNTVVLVVALLLIAFGMAGRNAELEHSAPLPDTIGFGVPWSHRLHADMPAYSCQNCHHGTHANQTNMPSCDADGCHLRGPATGTATQRLERLTVTFNAPAANKNEAFNTATRILQSSPIFRGLLKNSWNVAEADENADATPRITWKLFVDVHDAEGQGIEAPLAEISQRLESAIENVQDLRISPVPSARLAIHRNCIGCHNAAQKGPLECQGCHLRELVETGSEGDDVVSVSSNRGNEACGSCHDDVLSQLNSGAHKMVSCSACHSRAAERLNSGAANTSEALSEGAILVHAVEVPKARMRQDCLFCHGASDNDPTGFPRKQLTNDRLPSIRATADEAHRPLARD